MRIALYEPDIAPNTGTILRLCACLDVAAHIIEPAGFATSDRTFRRAGMDYLGQATIARHESWQTFQAARTGGRLLLLTVKGTQPYTAFRFQPDDVLLLGRESAGVPAHVHDGADARLRIPLKTGVRSINVAQAAAMVLGEALRQTEGFPA